jgi:hypothetical protein
VACGSLYDYAPGKEAELFPDFTINPIVKFVRVARLNYYYRFMRVSFNARVTFIPFLAIQ